MVLHKEVHQWRSGFWTFKGGGVVVPPLPCSPPRPRMISPPLGCRRLTRSSPPPPPPNEPGDKRRKQYGGFREKKKEEEEEEEEGLTALTALVVLRYWSCAPVRPMRRSGSVCTHTHTYCHTAAPKDEVDCRYTKRRAPPPPPPTPEKMSRTKTEEYIEETRAKIRNPGS